MWIFLSEAFLSIVQHDADSDNLLVRARLKGDIERVFSGYKVSKTPNADYLFRATVPRSVVISALTKAVAQIDYPNFKNSVSHDERHDAYLGVWSVMNRAQQQQLKEKSNASY